MMAAAVFKPVPPMRMYKPTSAAAKRYMSWGVAAAEPFGLPEVMEDCTALFLRESGLPPGASRRGNTALFSHH